jgi:hypothetical protein
LVSEKKYAEALREYNAALHIRPDFEDARNAVNRIRPLAEGAKPDG